MPLVSFDISMLMLNLRHGYCLKLLRDLTSQGECFLLIVDWTKYGQIYKVLIFSLLKNNENQFVYEMSKNVLSYQ